MHLSFLRGLYTALCALLFSFCPDTEPVLGRLLLGLLVSSTHLTHPEVESCLLYISFFSSLGRRPACCPVLAAIWCFLWGSAVYIQYPVNSVLVFGCSFLHASLKLLLHWMFSKAEPFRLFIPFPLLHVPENGVMFILFSYSLTTLFWCVGGSTSALRDYLSCYYLVLA